jgi:hypothetical protein
MSASAWVAGVFVHKNYDGDQHLNIAIGEGAPIADFARLVVQAVGYEGAEARRCFPPQSSRLAGANFVTGGTLSLAYRDFLAEDVNRREI